MQCSESTLEEKAASTVRFRDFKPSDSDFFQEINMKWINKHFVVEEQDRITLGNPLTYILQPGGCILIAEDDGKRVGCCALIRGEDDSFEVAKMAVADECRGRGIGRKLLAATIERARRLGAKRLYLESSQRLRDAVHLYEDLGFQHVPREQLPDCPYARADVFMQMFL